MAFNDSRGAASADDDSDTALRSPPRSPGSHEDAKASKMSGRHGDDRAQESRQSDEVVGSPRHYNTPSEPRSPARPAGIHTPTDSPYYSLAERQQHQELFNTGPMCMDPWDWKTDAPVFVPGGIDGPCGGGVFMPTGSPVDHRTLANGFPAQGTWALPPNAMQGAMDPSACGLMDGGMGMPDWHMGQSDNLRDMRSRMNQLEIETAQVKATWEMERRSLVRQISHYRAVLERYCIPVDEAGPSCMDQSYDTPGVDELQDVGAGNYYPGFDPAPPSQWHDQPSGPGDLGGQQSNSIDAKMQQLSHMLQEGGTGAGKSRRGADAEDRSGGEGSKGYDSYANGSIESTLRIMFPHAKVRTTQPGQEESDSTTEANPIIQQLRRIEKIVGGQADERALKALQQVDARQGMDALVKVEELVNAQGGQCRNLSSILQSVCRKIEKSGGKGSKSRDREQAEGREGREGREARDSREAREGREGREGRESRDGREGRESRDVRDSREGCEGREGSKGQEGGKASAKEGKGSGKSQRRSRKGDEDGDAFDAPPESGGSGGEAEGSAEASKRSELLVRTNSVESDGASKLNTPAGKRSNRSWADILSGDEDEPEAQLESLAKPAPTEPDPWTTKQVEKVGKKHFELRQKGEGWQLKISMANLEPKITEAGMEKYCRWLQAQLAHFQEEKGSEPLKHCRGEIDFSQNEMSNQMLWGLLETLAQFKVHVACLKLFANKISQGGILALCEFIRENNEAEPIQEMHLSHNEIDDEAALELMRTLQVMQPRYPGRRLVEDTGESVVAPVWLRLNHNRIRDTEGVRKTAEQEGITLCAARDRSACGTTRCSRKETPLMHLHSFGTQSAR